MATSDRAAGAVTNPKGTERLHEYWVHGEGAAKIRWGEPGDFDRCVLHLGKFIRDPKGYCNLAHHAALGIYPATHAKELKGRAEMADSSADTSGRAESLAAYVRAFPLEDISVRTTRDGRIVDAYLAVFDTPAPIHDQDGDYEEELDSVVFNRAISDARPQGSRTSWRVGVFYNHGLTIMGTPSDRHSMPVAVPMDIKTDGHGVRATDKYHRSQFCDEIVEGLESGAIPGYSFSGRFLRSSPLIPRGGFRKGPGGLPKVRRMESTLREYGPTPFPAYADAAVLGIRSDSLMAAMMSDPELAMRMLTMLRDGAPPDEADSPPPPGAPDEGLAAEDSRPRARSGRSIREQVQRNAALLLQQQYRR